MRHIAQAAEKVPFLSGRVCRGELPHFFNPVHFSESAWQNITTLGAIAQVILQIFPFQVQVAFT